MQEVLKGIVSSQEPLYKILAVRLAAYEGGTVEKLSPLYTDTLFHMLLGGICSVYQGNRDQDTYVDLVTIEGGNALLPQKIGEILESRLYLNMPLTRVSKNKTGLFQLAFQNGTEIETDILALAIPCSVYESISFEDDIILNQKLEVIRKIQYGANAKIMVPFATVPAIMGSTYSWKKPLSNWKNTSTSKSPRTQNLENAVVLDLDLSYRLRHDPLSYYDGNIEEIAAQTLHENFQPFKDAFTARDLDLNLLILQP